MSTTQITEYSRSDEFGLLINGFGISGLVLVLISVINQSVLGIDVQINLTGWGMVFVTSGVLLFAAMYAQERNMSDGTVMGFLSWGLFAPFTLGFQAITLVSFGNINQIIPTGGGLVLGPLTFGPWWFYF